MKCSLGISNFLEEISSLSYCIIFLYFFALITEEGFLLSPCYSLELCIQMAISFLFSFAFSFSSFLSYLLRPPQMTILPFCISFSCGWSWSQNRFPNLGIWQRDWESPGNLTLEAVGFDYRTYTGLEKQTLGGHKQNLVRTRTQEKGAVTPQETDPDFPVSVQASLAEAWVGSSLLQGQGHWVQQCVLGTFRRRSPFFFITSTIGWSQVKQ